MVVLLLVLGRDSKWILSAERAASARKNGILILVVVDGGRTLIEDVYVLLLLLCIICYIVYVCFSDVQSELERIDLHAYSQQQRFGNVSLLLV